MVGGYVTLEDRNYLRQYPTDAYNYRNTDWFMSQKRANFGSTDTLFLFLL